MEDFVDYLNEIATMVKDGTYGGLGWRVVKECEVCGGSGRIEQIVSPEAELGSESTLLSDVPEPWVECEKCNGSGNGMILG